MRTALFIKQRLHNRIALNTVCLFGRVMYFSALLEKRCFIFNGYRIVYSNWCSTKFCFNMKSGDFCLFYFNNFSNRVCFLLYTIFLQCTILFMVFFLNLFTPSMDGDKWFFMTLSFEHQRRWKIKWKKTEDVTFHVFLLTFMTNVLLWWWSIIWDFWIRLTFVQKLVSFESSSEAL